MSQGNGHLDVSRTAPSEGTRRRFTVQRKDSAESVVSAKLESGQVFNVFICILKWISAVLIFLAVLFCIVTSKICLLVLGHQFKSVQETRTNTTKDYSAETNKQALVMMLVLTQMIPLAASLLYAIWTSLRRKSRPWPTKQGFIIVSILINSKIEPFLINETLLLRAICDSNINVVDAVTTAWPRELNFYRNQEDISRCLRPWLCIKVLVKGEISLTRYLKESFWHGNPNPYFRTKS